MSRNSPDFVALRVMIARLGTLGKSKRNAPCPQEAVETPG